MTFIIAVLAVNSVVCYRTIYWQRRLIDTLKEATR